MVNFLQLLASSELEETLTHLGIRLVGGSSIALIALLFAAGIAKDKYPQIKKPLFGLVAFMVLGTTSYLFGSTIYLNFVSDTKGPVHWHADFEIWACGNEIELRDPTAFLSNKIGTNVLHEHDDKRIHMEGVVVDREREANLGRFIEVVGGSLTQGRLTVPVNDEQLFEDDTDGDKVDSLNKSQVEGYARTTSNDTKYLELTNGLNCGDQPAEVQVFVYQYDDKADTYKQIKLEEPAKYAYSEESNVPPGDCIIMDFDVPKDFTDKLCREYGTRDDSRCVEFGVKEFNDKLCYAKDVTDYSSSSTRSETNLLEGEADLPIESSPEPDNQQVIDEEIL